ncbi:hypothetical protein V1477_018868 [Vespula maculifrons]|uniref:Uncharacterized protein n=1 Tax=Vespula maculifrons TaxID=7453 RepID=A0ABD2ATC3_VESMC
MGFQEQPGGLELFQEASSFETEYSLIVKDTSDLVAARTLFKPFYPAPYLSINDWIVAKNLQRSTSQEDSRCVHLPSGGKSLVVLKVGVHFTPTATGSSVIDHCRKSHAFAQLVLSQMFAFNRLTKQATAFRTVLYLDSRRNIRRKLSVKSMHALTPNFNERVFMTILGYSKSFEDNLWDF